MGSYLEQIQHGTIAPTVISYPGDLYVLEQAAAKVNMRSFEAGYK